MQSEFFNVALDQIRYSLVWEDSYNLYRGLQIQPSYRVLIVSSAGCNVLNTLLVNPRQVVAIDLNPVQNQLLLFKQYLILHHEYAVVRALLGLDGGPAVRAAWEKLVPTIPDEFKEDWSAFFRNHPAGLLTAGRLETYITGFYATLPPEIQVKLQQLVQFKNIPLQKAYFQRELHGTAFQEKFISYFDAENLSKGRAPELFRYAPESGGATFYKRLRHQVATTLVKNNFFFRFFFFGPPHLPEGILPPCYQQRNYAALRQQLPKLTVVTGEAVDFLLSVAGQRINKASLSNIFEYTSPQEFQLVSHRLRADRKQSLWFLYWNLLQEQGAAPPEGDWEDYLLSDYVSQEHACFFFRNVRVQEMQTGTALKKGLPAKLLSKQTKLPIYFSDSNLLNSNGG